eukprot:1066532-Rhodomonas_salina.2
MAERMALAMVFACELSSVCDSPDAVTRITRPPPAPCTPEIPMVEESALSASATFSWHLMP